MELAQALRGIVAQGQIAMPTWAQSASPEPSNFPRALGIYGHLTTHCFHGLDLWPPAVELARLQFFLQGVELTTTAAELSRLPDLTLTLFQGNALIGLVQVDSERFDQSSAPQSAGQVYPWG
ncbi:MAG: hypothetical protein HC929_14515 [Leptolyngbyaceae cyanobacterium SM2_5_2]|nr:hypothetical protein [Leptolyngbyaceae cyanobacterium SM2_5_2]